VNLCSGLRCRNERRRVGLTLHSLSVLTGISTSLLSSYELGGALWADAISKIEAVLESIDGLKSAVAPARLDLSDGAGLVAALEAHRAGRAPWNTKQPEPNPAVVTF